MHMTGWLPGRRLSLQLRVERMEDSEAATKHHAKLVAGSIHDDALLICEGLCMESFPSPYTVTLTTKSAVQGEPLSFPAMQHLHVLTAAVANVGDYQISRHRSCCKLMLNAYLLLVLSGAYWHQQELLCWQCGQGAVV